MGFVVHSRRGACIHNVWDTLHDDADVLEDEDDDGIATESETAR